LRTVVFCVYVDFGQPSMCIAPGRSNIAAAPFLVGVADLAGDGAEYFPALRIFSPTRRDEGVRRRRLRKTLPQDTVTPLGTSLALTVAREVSPMTRSPRLWAVAVSIALVTPACATMNVSSHVERGIDVSKYRTYRWERADALPVSDPRFDKDPFFHDYMQGAVEKQLALRGFQQAVDDVPDLLIHYHVAVQGRMYVNALDREDAYCSGDCAGVQEYEQGTIVLDIVDARRNTLIWRGWAQSGVDGVLDDRDRMIRTIDVAVERMLKRLPPSL
jgi:hypothetical protein